MKRFCAAAAVLLAAALCGCAQKVDMTPIWEGDLPNTGVHMAVSNAELLNTILVPYAPTREEAFQNHLTAMPSVQAEGQPVVTFYGVTAEDISLVYLESIDTLYVDYDRVKPQEKLDYVVTETADSVSYKLDTAYNFVFTVKTEAGEDQYLVVSHRSDIQ